MKKLLTLLLALCLLAPMCVAESGLSPVTYGRIASSNGATTPLYQLPNERHPVLKTLASGTAIMVQFEGTAWHKIKVVNTGDVGWVRSGEVTITTRGYSALTYGSSVTSAKTVQSSDGFAALRWGPGLEYDKMDDLPNGRYCWQYERSGDWSRVLLEDGRVGYVHSTLLKNTSKLTSWTDLIYGYVQVTGGTANFRADSNYSAKVTGNLSNGSVIELLGEKNSFFYFYSPSHNKYGYISIDIVSPEGLNRVAYATPLYYDNPEICQADVLWQLEPGRVLKVLASDGYVSRVQYDSIIGYVSNKDLVIHH